MNRSLLWRIAVPFIVLILVSIGGVSLYFSSYMERAYYDNLHLTLRTEADLLAKDTQAVFRSGPPYSGLADLVSFYALATRTRVTIIDPTGVVLGESSSDPSRMENHLDRPEVRQALESGEGSEIRFSDTIKQRFYYLALPVKSGEQIIGFVRLGSPLSGIENDLARLRATILTAGLVSIGLVVLLALVVADRTISPLRRLAREVSRMGLGQFNLDLPTDRKDEVGRLSQSFATMASRLNEQIDGYREERGKLDAVLRHMTDAILIVDGDGKVTLINPAAERIFNINSEHAFGKSLVEVVRQYQFVDLWRTSLQSGRQQIVTLETSPERLFVQGIATPLEKSLPGSTLLVFQDLTRVRKLETVRRDFVSNVSHELRTPLASLKALTETLHEGALDDPPAARRFLERMDHEIDNMTQLVRELLDLSKIESGRVPFNRQPVQPDGLVLQAVERMQLQADRAGLHLDYEIQENLPAVLADAERIEQVLVNLLHNAIKFTPPGGEIRVGAVREAGQVIFSIRDSGVGIAPDALSRIFERFYKADQSRSGGGTGLGLSIARHTIEAHAGRIWAESTEKAGSTFYFSLPLA